jgi:hypothetical protein
MAAPASSNRSTPIATISQTTLLPHHRESIDRTSKVSPSVTASAHSVRLCWPVFSISTWRPRSGLRPGRLFVSRMPLNPGSWWQRRDSNPRFSDQEGACIQSSAPRRELQCPDGRPNDRVGQGIGHSQLLCVGVHQRNARKCPKNTDDILTQSSKEACSRDSNIRESDRGSSPMKKSGPGYPSCI